MTAVNLSKTLIIVIAISGLVGCVVILFLILKCCRRSKSSPLPPIQPLAHHREKESNYRHHPYIPRNNVSVDQFGRSKSDTSLLKLSRGPSFHTDESRETPSSSRRSFVVPPSPSTNVTHRSNPVSIESHSDEQASVTQQYVPTTRQARSSSRARSRQPRSRVNSAASTHSTLTHRSARSLNNIHGAPHSARNSVQIVLPTPLAPQLQSRMVLTSATASYEELVGFADAWTTTPSRTTSRRSDSDKTISTRDVSRGRKTSPGSGYRDRRSSDTIDQLRRPEPQTQPRGRTTSHHSIQPPRTTSQNPSDGQAAQPGQGNRSSSHATGDLRSQSRSLSRSRRSPTNTPNPLFPQSTSRSFPHYTPSSMDNLNHSSISNGLSPPPVPPLPRTLQGSVTRAEYASSRRSNSIAEP